MGQALLLTGRPGVGKTTAIQAVTDRLGARAAGFYTEEVREGGRRTGFRLVALDGPTTILASVNRSGRYRVGRYRVHVGNLEQVGVEALRRALIKPGVAVVVIDEIGKMELFSAAFREVVQQALESSKPVLATVMSRPQPWVDAPQSWVDAPQPWVDAIKARPDVRLLEVTVANRQTLPDRILCWLQAVQEGCALLDV